MTALWQGWLEGEEVASGMLGRHTNAGSPLALLSCCSYDQFEPTKALGGADDDEYAAYYD
jgi:hypothetical protein